LLGLPNCRLLVSARGSVHQNERLLLLLLLLLFHAVSSFAWL
jgi:hypothetical protein